MTGAQKLHLTFLGTGTSSGVPMIGCECAVCKSTDCKDKRLRSSVLIRSKDTTVVIDTTPDFRQQMLRIDNKVLDGVVYTHAHKDHIAGLDDVRAYNFFQRKDMPLYATTATQKELKREFNYAFAEKKYPGIPQLALHTIQKNVPFTIGDITFLPIEVWHHKMPVMAFRIKDFAYVTDANFITEDQMQQLKGIKTLVITALRKEKHISHFTLQEAMLIAEELGAQHVYFTHLSHQLGKHSDINFELPSHMQLAYDDLKLTI